MTISLPGLSRHTARSDQPGTPGSSPARLVRLAAALAGAAALGAYLYVALSRIGYPFALEWLEGNSLVEVRRILAGQPLYPAPGVGYVPDGYPPLYFAVCAGAARVLGASYGTLRLVSLVSSLVCFWLVARLVRQETGSAAAGPAAAGLLAATYFVTGTWFDVARVDSLFLALSVAALYAVRRMRGWGGAVAAGALLAAVVLTKQTGAAEGVAVLAVLLPGPRRRLAAVAALTAVAVLGLSTLVLGLGSGGWYVYYVFELMGQHALTASSFGWFWTALLTAMGLAAVAVALGARRVPRELLAGCAALGVEGYAALVHSGGGINDVLPAYLALALLAGLALGRTRAPASRVSRWTAVAPGVLVLAQTALLLSGFRPAQQVPSAADRAVGENLLSGLRALGGTVAIPADPGLSVLAGQEPVAHQDAAYDVLRASGQGAAASFRLSAAAAVAGHWFSAIVTDDPGPPLGYPASLDQYYRRCPQPLLAGVPDARFRPVAGASVRPGYVWLPLDSGRSCNEAVGLLDGTVKEARHP